MTVDASKERIDAEIRFAELKRMCSAPPSSAEYGRYWMGEHGRRHQAEMRELLVKPAGRRQRKPTVGHRYRLFAREARNGR
jgi:hypothetical protein